jgi:hypothetical protein
MLVFNLISEANAVMSPVQTIEPLTVRVPEAVSDWILAEDDTERDDEVTDVAERVDVETDVADILGIVILPDEVFWIVLPSICILSIVA